MERNVVVELAGEVGAQIEFVGRLTAPFIFYLLFFNSLRASIGR